MFEKGLNPISKKVPQGKDRKSLEWWIPIEDYRSLAPTCTSKEAPAAPVSLSLAKMPVGLVGATAGSS